MKPGEFLLKKDDIIIYGNLDQVNGGVTVDCKYDHRVAMSFLILGGVSKKPIKVVGCKSIATSYPNFNSEVNNLGMNIKNDI